MGGFIKLGVGMQQITPFDNILIDTDKARIYGRLNAEKDRAYFNGVNPSSNNPCNN